MVERRFEDIIRGDSDYVRQAVCLLRQWKYALTNIFGRQYLTIIRPLSD
jgi:hypothetical protein